MNRYYFLNNLKNNVKEIKGFFEKVLSKPYSTTRFYTINRNLNRTLWKNIYCRKNKN